jgi:hypothetical protein
MTTRYIIVKQEQDMQEMGCQHTACDVFHKKWRDYYGHCTKPIKPRPEWVIIDTTTNERPNYYTDTFLTKQDAKTALTRLLNILTKGEQQ